MGLTTEKKMAINPTDIESEFPFLEVSRIAERESWRKEINRPLYHIHKWWATRLGSVFRALSIGVLSRDNKAIWEQFYKKHDMHGKIILDPFMGSGTTLGEAVKLGAKAVGCDINPISTFLARQAFINVSIDTLKKAFEELKNTAAREIKYYYQTIDRRTGFKIPVLYFFWVKTVTTPAGEVIPLFSRYVFSQDAYAQKKPMAQIICPECWRIFKERYDAINVRCSHCGYAFNPQIGPAKGKYVTDGNGRNYPIKELLAETGRVPDHKMYALLALNLDGTKNYQSITDYDLALYEKAKAALSDIDVSLPDTEIRSGYNTDQAKKYNYLKWSDFFNSRQLLCLGILLRAILKIKEKTIQEHMLCLFSSTLEFNNMFCSFKGEGTGAVRPVFSNHIFKPERTPLENSVWGTNKSSGTFCTLFESRLLPAKNYLNQPFEIALDEHTKSKKIVASNPIKCPVFDSWYDFSSSERGMLIINCNSANLPLPNCSVDAVLTDPPYFDFVHYSELSDFFFAWLCPALKTRYTWMNQKNSFNKGEVQHKDPIVFADQLTCVFKETHRVLKNNGVLAFSFHYSRPDGWAAIYDAINKSGFVVVRSYPVYAELKNTSLNGTTKSPISLDAILVCRKKQEMQNSVGRSKKLDYAKILSENGIKLSNGDLFVIAASQSLVDYTDCNLSYEDAKAALDNVYNSIFQV